jgi:hypothetical protein
MPSPYDQNDLILTQRNSSDTHFQEVRIADVPNTVLSFDGSSTIRTLSYSQNDDSGSLIQRDSSGDAAIGSRLYFTDASANNGTTALIGLNASTARDFAIYDYAAGGGYLLKLSSGSRNAEIFGGLIQSGSTRIDSAGNGYFNNLSASSVNVDGSLTALNNTSSFGYISASFLEINGNQVIDGYLQLDPVIANIPSNVTSSFIYVSGSTNDLYFTQNSGGYSNTTRLRWLEGNMYTGLLKGATLSTGSSTTFNVSAGSGIIVTLNASVTQEPYPTIKYVNWNALTNQPLTYLTSSIQTFIGIDSTGNIVQQTEPWNNGQYNDTISIGTILHQNKTTINAFIAYPNVAYGYKQRTYDFIKAFGPLKLSGLDIVTSGSLGLNVATGTAWADGRNYQNDPNNPSYITDTGTSVSKIFRYYQSGSSFVQDTNGGLGYTKIDPTQYNNGGTLTAVTGNNPNNSLWTIQRVFWYPNSATKGIVVYYGNSQYSSSATAISNLNYETFKETPNTQQNAVYLGALIVRKDATWSNFNSYQVLPSGLFRSIGGTGGGGSVVTTRLSDLNDVSINAPATLQPLVYDHIINKWVNNSSINADLTGSVLGNAATATTASYVSPSGNAFVQGGNSFATTAVIGTNDTHSLHLETSGSTRVAVTPDGKVGVNTISPSYNLEVNGTFAANTKSFKIDHPTKEGYKLIYGSLESPYHGIRLTGKSTAVKGYAKVVLPEYIYKLVRHNDINIQLTNIRHSRVLYVNEVNVSENYFVVAYDKQMFDGDKTFEFYWDFTAERQDIDKLESEVKV